MLKVFLSALPRFCGVCGPAETFESAAVAAFDVHPEERGRGEELTPKRKRTTGPQGTSGGSGIDVGGGTGVELLPRCCCDGRSQLQEDQSAAAGARRFYLPQNHLITADTCGDEDGGGFSTPPIIMASAVTWLSGGGGTSSVSRITDGSMLQDKWRQPAPAIDPAPTP